MISTAGSKILLDTNIVIAILNQEPSVFERASGYEWYLSSVVLGELYFGAYKSNKVAENIQVIQTLIDGYEVLDCNETTADCYGRIKKALKEKGCPIPENDVWIAAIAMQYQLPLISRDRHMNEVEGIAVEIW